MPGHGQAPGPGREHYWFRSIAGGESLDFVPEGPDGEWQVAPGESAEDVFGLYRDEIERANAVIGATPLGMPPRQTDPQCKEWGIDFPDLRYIMPWVIGETACHAGHLDAVAELIGGRQWVVL